MRGVEAPFQLLIAVFTMAMVMSLAYFVLQRVQTEHCEDMWLKDMQGLALKIQSVAGAGAGTKATQRLTLRCGSSGKHVIRLRLETKSNALCRAVCGSDPPCVYIQHTVYSAKKPDEVIYSRRVCVEISPYTYYKLGSQDADCPEGYTLEGNAMESEDGWSPTGPRVDLLVWRPTSTDIAICARTWG